MVVWHISGFKRNGPGAFMSDRKTINSEYVYRGKVVTLRIDTVEREDGGQTKREIVEHHGAVAIVPLLDSEQVLLIRQYRQAVEESQLEISARSLDNCKD